LTAKRPETETVQTYTLRKVL